jgi:hypothetical protein
MATPVIRFYFLDTTDENWGIENETALLADNLLMAEIPDDYATVHLAEAIMKQASLIFWPQEFPELAVFEMI